MILALWGLPRSRSTAFFRMMLERGDFTTLHEPFSNRAEFGVTQVDGRAVRTEPELLAALRALGRNGPVFFKDTTDERYPGLLADESFLGQEATHIFLIRHPRHTVASYHALNPAVRREQIGVEWLHEIFTRVRALRRTVPVVVDSDDLVDRPEAVVAAYCAAVGIPYRPEALRWRAGERPEWRATARWHVVASRSEGFTRDRGDYPDVSGHPVLAGYIRHHLPFYDELYAHRLRA